MTTQWFSNMITEAFGQASEVDAVAGEHRPRKAAKTERALYYDTPYYDGAPSEAFKPKQELDAVATPFS
uniref:Uncharacterized protein n=1 Tax=Oryza glumipatula TaxID=40148 RepID=A0A0E0A9R7_9ORYZ